MKEYALQQVVLSMFFPIFKFDHSGIQYLVLISVKHSFSVRLSKQRLWDYWNNLVYMCVALICLIISFKQLFRTIFSTIYCSIIVVYYILKLSLGRRIRGKSNLKISIRIFSTDFYESKRQFCYYLACPNKLDLYDSIH